MADERQVKYSRSWFIQYAALTHKSWKVVWYRKLTLALLVLAPSVSVIVLYLLFTLIGRSGSHVSLDDKLEIVSTSLSRCILLDGDHRKYQLPNSSEILDQCISVGYVPDIANRAKPIMEEVATSVSLNYGADIVEFSGVESMSEFMWKNPGYIDLALVFAPDNFSTYELWVNSSAVDDQAWDGRLLTLQKSVDTAIIKQFYSQAEKQPLVLDFSVQLGAFTDIRSNDKQLSEDAAQFKNESRCDLANGPSTKQNVIGIVGSPLIAAGVGISTILVLMLLVSEKQKNLVGKLRQMGLKESTHIASWYSVFLLLALMSSALAVLIMKLVSHQLYAFQNTSFVVLFVTLYVFHVAMIGVAFILAAIFTKPAWIMTISSLVFLGTLLSTLTLNLLAVDTVDAFDESGKCFRSNNIWVLHKSKHFYEFLIFWFPWISYGQIFFDMYATTIYGRENYSFGDLGVQRIFIDTTRDPSVKYLASPLLNSIWSMLGIWIISIVLSWYLGQALAGRTNGRRPWYFPFQRGYWGYIAPPAPYKPGDSCAEEREESKREGSLKVFKLSKSYKSGTALREVSVTMNNGEVFVLLGHNGAGKSTLINILTGLTDATYGDVYFAGYSLNSGMSQFQSVCGICPQFDALWDELNAEEHLRVCAAMQGLHGKKATEEIKDILEAVDLLGERKDMVTTFSGGMKRRLSVCMATLGDHHKVIFLDEPTTGVDTINKKRIWQLIERLKHNRVIVLTTHNMEEADALGDKIAVLHQGALKAVGSSLFLKKKFGSGYQVSLLLASAEDAPEVEAIVKRVLPGAKITQSAAGNMKVSLNHNTALAIPKLLKELKVSLPSRENAGGEACSDSVPLLKDWGISNTTLEEVFLRLSAQNNQQVNEDEDAPDVDSENLCLICGLRKSEVVTLYTSTGISVKVPNAICLTCALAAQPDGSPELHGSTTGHVEASEEASDRLSDKSAVPHKQVSAPESLNINIENDGKHRHESTDGSAVSSRGRVSLFRSQIWAVLYKNFKLNMVQKKALIFYLLIFLLYVFLMKFLGSGGGSQLAFERRPVCPGRSELVDDGICSPQQFLQSLVNSPNKVLWDMVAPEMAVNVSNATSSSDISRVGVIPLVWYSTEGNLNFEFSASNDSAVQFKRVQGNDGNALFISGQKEVQRNSTPAGSVQSSCPMQRNDRQLFVIADASMANATFDSLFPTSGIALSTDASRNANTVQVSSIVRYKSSSHSYSSEKIWIRAPNVKTWSCYYYEGIDPYRGLVSLYYTESRSGDPIAPSVAPSLAINALSNALLGASVSDTGSSKIVTTVKTYPQLNFVSGAHSSETPFDVLILVIMGLSIFFPLYVRRLLMERESGLLQMMSIAGMQPAAYWLGNYIYDFILSVAAGSIFFIIGRIVGVHEFANASPVLCAVTIIVWAHALNGMTAFTAGLFKSVRAASLFAVIGLIISAVGSSFINFKYTESERMPPAAAIFPPLALARILCLLFSSQRSGQDELTVDIIVLVFASTALYLIGVFVNEVRASPNFWSSLLGFSHYKAQTLKVPSDPAGDSVVNKKALDENDVVLEKERVKGSPSTRFAIKTENLMKVFPASRGKAVKVAVDKLTLGLEYGEIFGLLGANGAGKTTALSMLSGSLVPSEGYIEIGGKRLTGKNQISSNQLSICPQGDVVWKDLSVWTHFMFYAYLKGLSSVEARASVQVIAADLSLDGDSFHKIASSLSGGQLRRLSFGISLIGSPSILLMDEITTGLDPVSRTTIWDVVKKQSNSGRLILLTTHSMEEADTLCTRIGIMSHGRMKCLGAPLYLKNRYSNGYTLTIVTENEVQESASLSIDSLIQKAAPDATRVYTWRRVHIYSIKTFDLNYLFQLLEDNLNKYQYGIREWQIEQTTLQDVFLRVSEE